MLPSKPHVLFLSLTAALLVFAVSCKKSQAPLAPDPPTPTPVPTLAFTATFTPSPTSTATMSPTESPTPTLSSTYSPTPTSTHTATSTFTQSPTDVFTDTPSPTPTPTSTETPTATLTPTHSLTPTPDVPSPTDTFTPFPTSTSTPQGPYYIKRFAGSAFVTLGDGGPATLATLMSPRGVAVDSIGNVYIADWGQKRVRKVDLTGTITTIAGNGNYGFYGEGVPATSAQIDATSVRMDTNGELLIADGGNYRIRKISSTGIISTIAGKGTDGFSGDGGPALDAELRMCHDVCRDPSGNLLIADMNNHRIRKVDSSGVITTIAGTGNAGFFGDGGPALDAELNLPFGIATDPSGRIFISDWQNNRVRRINLDGTITTVAGGGGAPYYTDGVLATSIQMTPQGIEFDSQGRLLIADWLSQRIFSVETNGVLRSIAGGGPTGHVIQNGDLATDVSITYVEHLAVDLSGNIYFTKSFDGSNLVFMLYH